MYSDKLEMARQELNSKCGNKVKAVKLLLLVISELEAKIADLEAAAKPKKAAPKKAAPKKAAPKKASTTKKAK